MLTNDEEIADQLRSLRGHGTRQHKYYYERVGYCSRLDAIQAAILQVKLPALHDWNEGRRRNAALYHELLADVAEVNERGDRPAGARAGQLPYLSSIYNSASSPRCAAGCS